MTKPPPYPASSARQNRFVAMRIVCACVANGFKRAAGAQSCADHRSLRGLAGADSSGSWSRSPLGWAHDESHVSVFAADTGSGLRDR
jgi:hypothetical protein